METTDGNVLNIIATRSGTLFCFLCGVLVCIENDDEPLHFAWALDWHCVSLPWPVLLVGAHSVDTHFDSFQGLGHGP